MSTHYALGPKL